VNLPITNLRRFDTHRLLPAKYSPNFASVLTGIADDEDLQLVFQLDNATNTRLRAEENLLPGITARELVYHVPNSHVINAAFTHANPLGARFSTSQRGAWYAAFELATAKAEVIFHKNIEFAEIDWKEREEIEYDDYLADFTALFHDLRGTDLGEIKEQALSPTSYVHSQQLAEELMQQGSLGIIYPSVRREGGTCVACFRPSVVGNVRKDFRYKLIWAPLRARMIRRTARSSEFEVGPVTAPTSERHSA